MTTKKTTSWWKTIKEAQWLKSIGLSREQNIDDESAEVAAPTKPPSPEVLGPVHQRFLRDLSEDNAEGLRLKEIGSKAFWLHLEGVWLDGHERLAVQWGEKFLLIATLDPRFELNLREKLADWYNSLGELRAAIEHLEKLIHDETRQTDSHYKLAESYARLGDEKNALKHYESVLARDIDYPNVQKRVQALRSVRGQTAPANSGQTMAGTELNRDSSSRYRLVRELGRGGSAAVFLAEDKDLRRQVAIKLLHPHLAAKDAAKATRRFFHEARITASLRHPNILAILDLEEESRRIVMELAVGGSLRHLLQTNGSLSVPAAMTLHVQTLSAVVAAHTKGIVHRDIKPANLLFRNSSETSTVEMMLADFGTAHLPGQPQKKQSQQELAGTIAYMAPEQRTGAPVDARWDVYSSAVVLYEMLHGKLPWDRQTILSGKREPSDLRLTPNVSEMTEVASRLRRHMENMTGATSQDRINSSDALAEATVIRDLASCFAKND